MDPNENPKMDKTVKIEEANGKQKDLAQFTPNNAAHGPPKIAQKSAHKKSACNTKSCRLGVMLSMTLGFFFVEIIVGYYCGSMALVADSFHMLSDVLALIIAFCCMKIARRRSMKNTFGWVRAEILGALVNAVFLLALCLSISVEAVKRLLEPEPIEDPLLVLVVGVIGLVVNVIGIFMFHGAASMGGHGHSHGGHGHSHSKPKTTQNVDDAELGGVRKEGRETFSYVSESHTFAAVRDAVGQEEEERDSVADTIENTAGDHGADRKGSYWDEDSPVLARRAISKPLIDDKKKVDNSENGGGKHGETTEAHEKPQKCWCCGLFYPGALPDTLHIRAASGSTAQQLNMHGVFLHILGDAFGSVIVVLNALLVWQLDNENVKKYLDPSLSLVMVSIICMTTVPLLKETALILLQTAPKFMNIEALKSKLLQFDGVLAVHEFHVWRLAGARIIATAHIKFNSLDDYILAADKIKTFFHNHEIHSTTIQPEFEEMIPISHAASSQHSLTAPNDFLLNQCFLRCPPTADCAADKKLCCEPLNLPPPPNTTTEGVPQSSQLTQSRSSNVLRNPEAEGTFKRNIRSVSEAMDSEGTQYNGSPQIAESNSAYHTPMSVRC